MSYIPTVSVTTAAAAANMSSAANMAAAAYFKNGAYAAVQHMPGAALGFTANPAHNFLPGGMGYVGNSLADCQTASLTAWNASQASRFAYTSALFSIFSVSHSVSVNTRTMLIRSPSQLISYLIRFS